ncbi:predicted protein [Thalassiosira pseudonana CCMP1335]|uniref:Uncharacterized protein n=1 Tax=Thalassiosira pseudonana TaxID=35128 RepID=B8BSM1_THAPS|nr:predicted protein [Thalassiosira pseudonana CCMP1335]EED96151.1 predicted protein [Thalassiosira pseudonana CCMP1335]|eukprot:scaffold5369_cov214-Alexandrium_tamarense.AAC.4
MDHHDNDDDDHDDQTDTSAVANEGSSIDIPSGLEHHTTTTPYKYRSASNHEQLRSVGRRKSCVGAPSASANASRHAGSHNVSATGVNSVKGIDEDEATNEKYESHDAKKKLFSGGVSLSSALFAR